MIYLGKKEKYQKIHEEEPYSQNAKMFIVPFSFNKPISHENMISQRTFDHYCNLTRSHCGEIDFKGYLGKNVPSTLLFYSTLSKSDNNFKIIYWGFFTFIFQNWIIILDMMAQFIAQVFLEIKLWQTGNGSANQTSW